MTRLGDDDPPFNGARVAARAHMSRSRWVLQIATSVAVFAVVVLRFAPQFVLWRGLEAHAGWFTPELNRAAETLRQIEDPWHPIDNEVNAVLNWRLLFPLLAHYLHLPTLLVLLLPALGCLLTLGVLAHAFDVALRRRAATVAATMLLATTSWFLTSTGWLAYFDSWYVGGLVLAAFVDSRLVLAATCVLAPWIDERFVLGLPLVLAVRAVRRAEPSALRGVRVDALVCAGALAPVVLIRLLAIAGGGDAASVGYLRRYVLGHEHFPADPLTFLVGSWHGLRAAWVYVIAFAVLAAPAQPRRRLAAIAGIVVATYGVALFSAADISRSMSLLLPAAAMGVILVARQAPSVAPLLLGAALVCNLALPAAHVNAFFIQPIGHVFAELAAAEHPPAFLDPPALNQAGVAHFANGEVQDAYFAFDSAVRLDPAFAEARHNRGRALQEMGALVQARADYAAALALLPPDSPFRTHTEARLREVDALLAALPAGDEAPQ